MGRQRMSEQPTYQRAEAALRAVLPRSASVRVAARDSGADMVVNGIAIQAKWIGEGSLGRAREILTRKRDRPDVVVARLLSPGAREALSEAGVGWIDETGAAEISLGSIVVSKSGRPEPAREKPARWTPASLAVAEALLCGRKAAVHSMRDATGLSIGACTRALQVLSKLGLLTSSAARGRGSARTVHDPNQLLEAYAAAARAAKAAPAIQVGVTWQEVRPGLRDAGKKWEKQRIDWVATGAAAASVMAPYLTSVSSADVYLDAETVAELEAAAAVAGLRPIEGGRLTIRPFPTVTTPRLAEEVEGLRVAPWPRVYADLRKTGVRGEEAAEHLREVLRGR
jgi:hypothetical protein